MADQSSTALPAHLAALLHPTPTGIATLIAAWDGLSVESQILMLTALKESSAPPHLIEQVYIKALDSDNAYVRYLAVQQFSFRDNNNEEQQRLKQRIEQDPHPLVRYALLERKPIAYDSVAFFALPHEARLAHIRSLRNGDLHGAQFTAHGVLLQYVARLTAHAIDHRLGDGTVSETELFEILAEYVTGAEFTWSFKADIEALWQLVPQLPPMLSHVLIRHLPAGPAYWVHFPEDVLQAMTNKQLATLFRRADVELTELRKQIFFGVSQKKGYRVRRAAISRNFNLTYPEFLTILEQPAPEKEWMLCQLINIAQDLSLCFYDAIKDALDDMEYSKHSTNYSDVLRKKLKLVTPPVLGRQMVQLRELGLYRLARCVADQGVQLRDEVAFLTPSIVERDTWRTFMAFSTALKKRYGYRIPHTLEEYLTSFVRDDINYYVSAKEDTDSSVRVEVRLKEIEDGLKRIENRFTEMGERSTEMAERFTDLDDLSLKWDMDNLKDDLKTAMDNLKWDTGQRKYDMENLKDDLKRDIKMYMEERLTRAFSNIYTYLPQIILDKMKLYFYCILLVGIGIYSIYDYFLKH